MPLLGGRIVPRSSTALQQVSTRRFLQGAVPIIEPHMHALPVPVRRATNRALVAAGHAWVLHRVLILRSIAAVVALVLVIGIYQARDAIAAGAVTAAGMLQGEFASAGFAIESIDITGQSLTSETDIFMALAMQPKISTLSFDAEGARARLAALPAIEDATIRKIYPGKVVVTIDERIPVARWRVGGFTYLVDMDGKQIALDSGNYPELPLIVGEGANDDALIMLKSMERYDLVKEDLAALSRIGDRRWDLIYYTGLRVQLPENGVAQALDQLTLYQQQYALLDRDVTLIDLRVPGLVSYKRAVRGDAEGGTTTE
jgi:cell division protein FtsQ